MEFYIDILFRRNRGDELTVKDDHMELVELRMWLLGDILFCGMTWKEPRETHKARFCNFEMYVCKALNLF